MLKFIDKFGKIIGILKDDDSEPEMKVKIKVKKDSDPPPDDKISEEENK